MQQVQLVINGEMRPDLTPSVVRHRAHATVQVGFFSRVTGKVTPLPYNVFTAYSPGSPYFNETFYRERDYPLFADYLTRFDQAAGVDVAVSFSDGPTGTCVVLITDDAQRTMLTHLGVSADVGPDDVLAHEVQRADVVYVEGYLFSAETPRQAAHRAIALAADAPGLLALTVSDAFLVDGHREEFLELIRGPVDLLFCNEDEARSLLENNDTRTCAETLGQAARRVAITLGAAGALLVEDGRLIEVAGVPTTAVDTTGAGDMFAAGVLFGLTNGMTFQQSARLATHVASRIVSQMGARLPGPIPREEAYLLAGLTS